jgi:hypothetical protein
MIAILAGSAQQAIDYAAAEGLTRRQWEHVRTPADVVMIKITRIARVGTWLDQPLAYYMEQLCITNMRDNA